MHEVTKEMTFDMGHRLSRYHGKCYNLHGHTYTLQVTVGSEKLDGFAFVIDFTDLKLMMKAIVDRMDHKTMLFTGDELNRTLMDSVSDNDDWFYPVPFEPTAENISKHIYEEIDKTLKRLSSEIELISVLLWETPTSYAEYKKASN